MQTNLLEYLVNTAAARPGAVAFADEREEITFAALLDQARRVGTAILRRGAQTRPAVVLARRSVRTLVGLFGALAAGTCYVPVDAEMPAWRRDALLAQLDPGIILYDEPDAELAASLAGYAVLPLAEAVRDPAEETLLKTVRTLDTDPAYILFTSGSTGAPKGILVSHRSVIDFAEWFAPMTGVTETDVLGNQAPFFFDLSLRDLCLTLKTGAKTVILPKKCFLFPTLLVQELDRHGVTMLNFAASAFHLVAASGVLEKYVPRTVRQVVVGGEAMQARLLNRWRRALPEARFVNVYGPTETTVDCTFYPIDREFADDEPIPIGKACANLQVLLLKEDNTLAAPGEAGEICVRGSGLAIGYWNDPEKTAKAFVQNPLITAYPDRIYRTGDFGRLDGDGNILFLARQDDQIKHMGYRMELGEIETVLYSVPGITAAVCLFDRAADKLLCIYAGEPRSDELAATLRKQLPRYMLPNRFIRLEAMPYNANGKLDRAKLKREYLV